MKSFTEWSEERQKLDEALPSLGQIGQGFRDLKTRLSGGYVPGTGHEKAVRDIAGKFADELGVDPSLPAISNVTRAFLLGTERYPVNQSDIAAIMAASNGNLQDPSEVIKSFPVMNAKKIFPKMPDEGPFYSRGFNNWISSVERSGGYDAWKAEREQRTFRAKLGAEQAKQQYQQQMGQQPTTTPQQPTGTQAQGTQAQAPQTPQNPQSTQGSTPSNVTMPNWMGQFNQQGPQPQPQTQQTPKKTRQPRQPSNVTMPSWMQQRRRKP